MTTTKLLSYYAMPVAVCLALATSALANSGTKSSLLDLPRASGFVTDDGAAKQLVVTSKLMQQSQRIPAAACYEHFQIEKEQNAAFIEKGVALFNQILAVLELRDPSLGQTKTETDEVLADIAKTSEVLENTATALRDGMPAVGLQEPMDPAIANPISDERFDRKA